MKTVTVIYKSGAKVRIKCESFKLTYNPADGLRSATWVKAKPEPLFIGLDDIAAIYEGKA